jgi:hypothetical protein
VRGLAAQLAERKAEKLEQVGNLDRSTGLDAENTSKSTESKTAQAEEGSQRHGRKALGKPVLTTSRRSTWRSEEPKEGSDPGGV